LLRNGPGVFERFGKPYLHWFDGDGLLTAFRFGDGGIAGACRLIDTPHLEEERAAGRVLYGAGSTPAPTWSGRMAGRKYKNVANTNIVDFGGDVLALFEGAIPTRIDPASLDCLGTTDFGGTIKGSFSAHPHRVAGTDHTFNFGIRYGRKNGLRVYKRSGSGPVELLCHIPLDEVRPLVHDFMVTEGHIVFLVAPVGLRIWPIMAGFKSPLSCMTWKPEEGAEVIIVSLANPEKPRRFHVDSFFQWHFANGYERSGPRGTELVVDFIKRQDFRSFSQLSSPDFGALDEFDPGRLTRAIIQPSKASIQFEELSDLNCELPAVSPGCAGLRHRHVWMLQQISDKVVCCDTHTGALEVAAMPDNWAAGEPTFVPDVARTRDEKDGWIMSLAYDTTKDRSGLVIWDAQRLGDGPIASTWLDHHVPPAFHGSFLPA